MLAGRTIYFADQTYWPTPITRRVLTDRAMERRRAASGLPGLRRLAGAGVEFVPLVESPLFPVYLLERQGHRDIMEARPR